MQLETEHLIVRDFVEGDFEDVYAYGSDPLVANYMPFPPSTPEGALTFISRCIALAAEEPRRWYDMGIELRGLGRIIGGIAMEVVDRERGEACFAYLFHRDYWGRGYATEALAAMLRFGFVELGLRKIGDDCDRENVGSARVMEKCGLRLVEERDGLRRYEVTSEEWRSRQG